MQLIVKFEATSPEQQTFIRHSLLKQFRGLLKKKNEFIIPEIKEGDIQDATSKIIFLFIDRLRSLTFNILEDQQ